MDQQHRGALATYPVSKRLVRAGELLLGQAQALCFPGNGVHADPGERAASQE
jgi:hypothetical protein